ncbi:hypothetical protein BKA62DRAFT_692039 [Auriculariales sp. MPI-PUGE-AT-0066]|nr:hypothetical protein BKA62DRAFT_692039 [Auriculariales sp. MPI-PUGE-AT-0066]
MLRSLVPFVALAAAIGQVAAKACVVFDQNNNLLVLGPSTDYTFGTQDSWAAAASAKAVGATTTRPPFDGDRPRCHLAQGNNAVLALGVDKANPTAVWFYDAGANSWSMQAMASGDTPDPDSMVEVLDHDTDVLYAYSKQTMYFAHFDYQKAAKSEPIEWVNQGVSFPFDGSSYKATAVNINNHIHFFGAPGSQAGQNYIYVVHFAFPQPDAQLFPSTNGKPTFPASHGWATSIFDPNGKEQRQAAFIPDDLSATYIVDAKTNQTLPLAAPTKDSGSFFAASTSAVVQLTSDGKVFYLPVSQTDMAGTGANAAAAWKQVGTVATGGSGTPASGGSSSNSSANTPAGSGSVSKPASTGTTTKSTSSPSASPDSAAASFATVSWAATAFAAIAVAAVAAL